MAVDRGDGPSGCSTGFPGFEGTSASKVCVSRLPTDDFHTVVLPNADARVGGSEVDSDSFSGHSVVEIGKNRGGFGVEGCGRGRLMEVNRDRDARDRPKEGKEMERKSS